MRCYTNFGLLFCFVILSSEAAPTQLNSVNAESAVDFIGIKVGQLVSDIPKCEQFVNKKRFPDPCRFADSFDRLYSNVFTLNFAWDSRTKISVVTNGKGKYKGVVIGFNGPVDFRDYDVFKALLIQKYGKPDAVLPQTLKNAMGMTFSGEELQWKNGSFVMSLTKYLGTIETGLFELKDRKIYDEQLQKFIESDKEHPIRKTL